MMLEGVLLIDKPQGWTSFDVVNRVRYIISHEGLNSTHKKRFPVGHTGTLDPLATGLLVLLLGPYTKRAPELMKLDKTYSVRMKLGVTSTTGDEEGSKSISKDSIVPTRQKVEEALRQHTGTIMQTPPVFSAKKVNGRRAYELARQGKPVNLTARPVTIYRATLEDYTYPDVSFVVEVSSGTYVRSLVEDIGAILGTGAYMSGLRRTRVGMWGISQAIQVDGLSAERIVASVKALS